MLRFALKRIVNMAKNHLTVMFIDLKTIIYANY